MGSQARVKIAPDQTLITDLDFKRLSSIFDAVDPKLLDAVDDLDEKLTNAAVIKAEEAPSDLITMNSRVVCHLPDRTNESSEMTRITLVYPQDADIVSNRISVLSHVGSALLGRRVGEIVSWKGNDGCPRQMKIERLDYQPELSGDWHL